MNTVMCAPPFADWLLNFDTNPEQACGMNYGYARIWTIDKNPAPQLDALRADGCDKIFKDEGIGTTTKNCPALLQCLKTLRAGDTLTVWKLDRLSRDVSEIVNLSKRLQERGIALHSLSDKINTSEPGGQLALQYFAAGVQFHRNIVLQRGREGLQAAREGGLKTGPDRKLSPEEIEKARERIFKHGEPRQRVADDLQISRTTLWTYLNIKNDTPGNALSIPPPRQHRVKAASPKNE
jgi:DNA invertase Pin-like site-specific DNA recombinase